MSNSAHNLNQSDQSDTAIAQEIAPSIELVEGKRVEALAKKSKGRVIGFVVFAALSLLGFAVSGGSGIGLIIGLVLGVILGFVAFNIIAGSAIQDFQYTFKTRLIGGVLKCIAPGMNYYPERGISKEVFRGCGHYRTGIDRYTTEDRFEGKVDSTELYFAELHAEYESESTDSDDTTTSYHTIFKGIMLVADFHKSFNTTVMVRPDNERDGVFGFFNKALQSLSSKLIKLENPEFERHFKVHGDSDQEARYILTPDMQQRLLDLRSHFGKGGKGLILSFQNSAVTITIPMKENLFEPDIKTPASSQAQITRLANQVKMFLGIVETLNLNTRIWTKT